MFISTTVRARQARILLTLAVVVILAFSPPRAPAAQTEVTLKVGVIPIADLAPLYLGIQKGFFRDEQLDLQPVSAQGGAAIVPAVIAGDDQVGFSNMVSLMLASAHGLTLRTVMAGSEAVGRTRRAPAAVMTIANGPIKNVKDLEGKTIAVNTVNNIGDVTIRDVLEQRGVNVSSIKFVELGFAEMPVALTQGRVDAIWANEPFVTVALAAGARVLFNNYESYDPNLTVASYFTSTQYADAHPDVIARLQRALARSLTYAEAHPEETRSVLSVYTRLEPNLSNAMALPRWSAAIHMASVKKLQSSMLRFGLLKGPVDLSALIPHDVPAIAR